jgi:hypothetical protein
MGALPEERLQLRGSGMPKTVMGWWCGLSNEGASMGQP